MIDSKPKNETLRALAFPLALFGVTAAVFFGVTATSDKDTAAQINETAQSTPLMSASVNDAVENVEAVSFDYTPDAPAITDIAQDPLNDIGSAVSASLSWSTKSLPDQLLQTNAPSAALAPSSPMSPPLLTDVVAPRQSLPGARAQEAAVTAQEPHGAHGDHQMMDMPAADPNLSACVAELKTIAARTRVYFGTSTAAVPAQAKAAIYQIAALAQRCPEAEIVIDGFTDPKGDANENLLLSWKRANNVLAAMRSAGFQTTQFSTHSHMDNHPDHCVHYDVVDRRVEFVVTQNETMAKTDTPLIERPAQNTAAGLNVAAIDVPRTRPLPRPY